MNSDWHSFHLSWNLYKHKVTCNINDESDFYLWFDDSCFVLIWPSRLTGRYTSKFPWLTFPHSFVHSSIHSVNQIAITQSTPAKRKLARKHNTSHPASQPGNKQCMYIFNSMVLSQNSRETITAFLPVLVVWCCLQMAANMQSDFLLCPLLRLFALINSVPKLRSFGPNALEVLSLRTKRSLFDS